MRRLLLAALALLWPAVTAAQPYDTGKSGVSEVLLRAMHDELRRTEERLRLEELAPPYFVAYTVLESHGLEIEAELGALKEERAHTTRRLQVEVRVGSREFDDSHFVPRSGHGLRPLSALVPAEDDYDALRAAMWTLTDEAYKDALERLARKTVYRDSNNIRDPLADLTEDPVESSRVTSPTAALDRDAWAERAREISSVFREHPAIQSSSVELSWRAQHVYFTDSEGRSYVKPGDLFELEIEAEAQASDGMVESDRRRLLYRSLDHVPPTGELRRTAEELATSLTALAAAPKAETYLGPVLLDGEAAGEFFSQLLASGLANPREIWVEQDWAKKYYPSGALTGRLGLRVTAPIFDVVDDPTREEFEGQRLIGNYDVDDEGIPARRVRLVEHGILRDLLMSRSPAKERDHSNGHGRGVFGAPAAATIGNLFVTPSSTVSLEKMKRRLRDEAAAFGLDHGLLIRRIAPERERDEGELLAAPVLVYEVDVATGEERLVRDAAFHAVTMRALRDVIAASNRRYVYNLAKPGPFRSSVDARSSIVHPAVLLSEMELVPSEEKPSRPPHLPRPPLDSPATK